MRASPNPSPRLRGNARMQAAMLAGNRLHLNDGPIDLVIGADGESGCVPRAFDAAMARFETILGELCAELPLLRSQMTPESLRPEGIAARRMADAVRPLSRARFITPMAAVAGAVADEILGAMVRSAPLDRAYVNNGGDIAIHLAEGAAFGVGLADHPGRPSLFGTARISARDGIGGIATSGRHGRSFSLGIADAVTVLARDAAAADAAATLIANAVDLPGHPEIARAPATDFDPQSDLGARLVTRGVGPLTRAETERALAAGDTEALRLIDMGAINGAALHLNGATRVTGPVLDHALTATQRLFEIA